jgi:hypothetical protein
MRAPPFLHACVSAVQLQQDRAPTTKTSKAVCAGCAPHRARGAQRTEHAVGPLESLLPLHFQPIHVHNDLQGQTPCSSHPRHARPLLRPLPWFPKQPQTAHAARPMRTAQHMPPWNQENTAVPNILNAITWAPVSAWLHPSPCTPQEHPLGACQQW